MCPVAKIIIIIMNRNRRLDDQDIENKMLELALITDYS